MQTKNLFTILTITASILALIFIIDYAFKLNILIDTSSVFTSIILVWYFKQIKLM